MALADERPDEQQPLAYAHLPGVSMLERIPGRERALYAVHPHELTWATSTPVRGGHVGCNECNGRIPQGAAFLHCAECAAEDTCDESPEWMHGYDVCVACADKRRAAAADDTDET